MAPQLTLLEIAAARAQVNYEFEAHYHHAYVLQPVLAGSSSYVKNADAFVKRQQPQADLHEKITDLRDQFDDLMQEEATKATPTKNFQRIAELESQLQCEMDNFCLIDQVLAKQHLANESKLS